MRGTGRLLIPLLVVFALVAGVWGVIYLQDLRPRLGLDLRGGTSVIYGAENPAGGPPSDEQLNTTVDIIRNRVNGQGVAEAEVAVEGDDIVVSLPDVRNPDQVIEAVGRTAQLRFRPVLEVAGPNDPKYREGQFGQRDCAKGPVPESEDARALDKEIVMCAVQEGTGKVDATSLKLRLGPVALSGTDVDGARAGVATSQQGFTTGQWVVNLDLSGEGADKFAKMTGELACKQDVQRQLAIVLDGAVISHPPVADDVQCNVGITGGQAQITGLTEAEAKELAPLIATGALPLTLEVQNRQTVSPTLGADSLRAGLVAGALGLALVLLYVLVFYRGLGLVIWVGLLLAAALNVGAVILLGRYMGFTLTLAGIAGLIVAVGISADTYVVFFERLKDEVREGRTLRASVDRGWQRSFHTLVSANAISFAAAVVLYLLAVGPVRGFAFTLGLATLIDFFAAWFFARPAVGLVTRLRLFQEGRFVGIRAAV